MNVVIKDDRMTDNISADKPMQGIAYLLEDFLTPTTTFITQEVQYLQAQGYNLRVFVAGHRTSSEVDPAVAGLEASAQYSRPVRLAALVFSHLMTLLRFPTRYLATFWHLIALTWRHPVQNLRTLRHFTEGIYLGRQMDKQGIRWVHSHFAGRATTTAWVIWQIYRIPYSLTTHAYDLFSDLNNPTIDQTDANSLPRPAGRSLLKSKLEEAQVILTISEFNLRYMADIIGIQRDKIRVAHCGIDMSRFHRLIPPVNDQPIILSVGALVEKKGHDVLLRACAYLLEWGYVFRCKIVGEGPLLSSLVELKNALALGDCVQFCGRIHHSQLPVYHQEADIFVLACVKGKDGDMDGIPVALMEAMGMGIPVVTTRISGIPELVEADVTGCLADPGDAKELANNIRRLLDDSQVRLLLGGAGRDKVLKDFDQATTLPLVVDTILSGQQHYESTVRGEF